MEELDNILGEVFPRDLVMKIYEDKLAMEVADVKRKANTIIKGMYWYLDIFGMEALNLYHFGYDEGDMPLDDYFVGLDAYVRDQEGYRFFKMDMDGVYDFNFTDKFDSKVDTMQEQYGVGVVVDKKSDLFLDGTTVDFYLGLDKRGFTFDNPNAVKSSGCGSSFSAY